MGNQDFKQVEQWLDSLPPLSEIRARYPEEWRVISDRLLAVSTAGTQGMHDLIAEFSAPQRLARDRQQSQSERISQLVRRRMLVISLRTLSDRNESGVHEGSIRFGWLDGLLLQGMLFDQGLVRKPVRLTRFRATWPLLSQRDRLMPLVRARGIYCFYSKQLITELGHIIGPRDALEIAAGDGTLSRFLTDAGTPVLATDDHSWARSIRFPAMVKKMDARAAVAAFKPRVVICSWPPAGNSFEGAIFAAPSVETYIVITSRDEREASNWAAYRRQTDFDLVDSPSLASLVLPPGRNRVLIFSRHNSGAG